jgi:D-amino-acid dehydrogenase
VTRDVAVRHPGDVEEKWRGAPLRFSTKPRIAVSALDNPLRMTGSFELARPARSMDRLRIRGTTVEGGQLLGGIAGREDVAALVRLRPCTPDGLPLIGAIPGTICMWLGNTACSA